MRTFWFLSPGAADCCTCGLVGHDVCFTRRRSPVRFWARVFCFLTGEKRKVIFLGPVGYHKKAPPLGIEPRTCRLTADRSANGALRAGKGVQRVVAVC